MRLISFDTETELIARGRQVPRVVVGSYAELDLSPQGGRPWQQCNPRILNKGLVSHQDLDAWLLPLLDDPEIHFTSSTNSPARIMRTSGRCSATSRSPRVCSG